MKIFILQMIAYCLAIMSTTDVLAAEDLGHIAQNLLGPVTLFSDIVQTGCFVIGGAFLFAAVIKYFEHKRSPLMTPISTVIFLFIAGLALVLIPFISFLVNGGVQYSLMK